MNLLVIGWNAYTQPDINETFRSQGVSFRQVNYAFPSKDEDPFFERKLTQYLKEDTYDAVFSVNYFPVIASVCYANHVKYISWSYDNPLNVVNVERTLGYETNYLFLFDRIQAEGYQKQGFDHIYHLPLAVNPSRLSSIRLSDSEWKLYQSDISFVGKLYPSLMRDVLLYLNDYQNGYLSAISAIQSKLYGCYIIDDMLTEDLLQQINEVLDLAENTPYHNISREQLSYTMATNITREERLLLLGYLSKKHHLNLYSYEQHPVLSAAHYRGTAGYFTEMPKVFKASRINLNITLKILQTGMPLRSLDILGCGGFLLSNYQEELFENFIPGTDLDLYTSIEDAIEKTNYYLSHEELRAKIAQNGQKKVFEQFHYERQLKTIFQTAGIL